MRRSQFLIGFILAVAISAAVVSCGSGSASKLPAQIRENIEIPDGEFLKYGHYQGGEKTFDGYAVTRVVHNEKGEKEYHVYTDMIMYPKSREIDPDYTKWPCLFIINTRTGSVTSGTQVYDFSSDEQADYSEHFGFKNLISTQYTLHENEGYVELKTKSWKNDERLETAEKRSTFKIEGEYPVWDAQVGIPFVLRILNIDAEKDRYCYYVTPTVMKTLMLVSYKTEGRKKMKTPAGEFEAVKAVGVFSDWYISLLFKVFLSNAEQWIEDSDRRLTLSLKRGEHDLQILEEVSNIKTREFESDSRQEVSVVH